MKIYLYSQQLSPRPSCVDDGGYLYSKSDEKVIGFGTLESELEIDYETATSRYDTIFAGVTDAETAEEFFARFGVYA